MSQRICCNKRVKGVSEISNKPTTHKNNPTAKQKEKKIEFETKKKKKKKKRTFLHRKQQGRQHRHVTKTKINHLFVVWLIDIDCSSFCLSTNAWFSLVSLRKHFTPKLFALSTSIAVALFFTKRHSANDVFCNWQSPNKIKSTWRFEPSKMLATVIASSSLKFSIFSIDFRTKDDLSIKQKPSSMPSNETKNNKYKTKI